MDAKHSTGRIVATILIDRVTHAVTNSYSSGPGLVPHSYDLVGGGHVREIAGVWTLEPKHGAPRIVRVEIERYRSRPCACDACKATADLARMGG